jgi:hypothetical protein
MSLIDAIVTAGLTTGLGLLAFVAGQFALKLVVEPIQQEWRAVGGVAHALVYYRNVGRGDPRGPAPEREAEARRVYRDLAGEFRRNLRVVPRYEVFVRLGVVLPSDRVRRASTALIGLANTVHKGHAAADVNRYRFEVEKNLGIDR